MHTFNKELKNVEARVDHIENKMGEFANTLMTWWMPVRGRMRRWSGSKLK